MRRLRAATVVFTTLACIVGAPAGAGAGERAPAASVVARAAITGGSVIAIRSAPWQVRIRTAGRGLCGGALIDAQQVVTAAHCTYDGDHPLAPAELSVVSGSSAFDPDSARLAPAVRAGDDPVISQVAAIRRHPGFNATADGTTSLAQGRDDVAVLTLAAPVVLDGVVRQAIALPERNAVLRIGTRLSVTGFGLIDEHPQRLDGRLRRLTDMTLLDPAANSGIWNADYLAVSSPTGLDCSGDSGGPLVLGSGASAILVGLVSFSADCNPRTVSTYVNVAAGEIRDFITGSDQPPSAPIGGRDARVTLDREGRLPLDPGRVLTCMPGSWTGSPQFSYTFTSDSGAVLQNGPASTYTVTRADRGHRIRCRATAAGDGGVGQSQLSPATAVVGARAPRARMPARISVGARVRTGFIGAGDRFSVTLRLRSYGPHSATRVVGCLTLPPGVTVLKRDDATLSGDRLCFRAGRLRPFYYLEYDPVLRLAADAPPGTLRLRLRGSAANARAAAVTASIKVL